MAAIASVGPIRVDIALKPSVVELRRRKKATISGRTGSLCRLELTKNSLSIPKIRSSEPFSERSEYTAEDVTGLICTIGSLIQAGKARGRAQIPGLALLTLGDLDRLPIVRLGHSGLVALLNRKIA